jgi:hypothetical protein
LPRAPPRLARVALGGLGALALAGCPPAPAPPAAAAERFNLKVTLPEGWRASPFAGGLAVGPGTRVVLELEPSTRPLPSRDALAAAVERQGGRILKTEDSMDFVGVAYLLSGGDGGAPDGFLAVRRAGKKTVWCASTAGATSAEVAKAWDVCARVQWAGADAGD